MLVDFVKLFLYTHVLVLDCQKWPRLFPLVAIFRKLILWHNMPSNQINKCFWKNSLLFPNIDECYDFVQSIVIFFAKFEAEVGAPGLQVITNSFDIAEFVDFDLLVVLLTYVDATH